MKTLIACILCLCVGSFLGCYAALAGAEAAMEQAIKCIKDPSSCGLDSEEDFTPDESLIPA